MGVGQGWLSTAFPHALFALLPIPGSTLAVLAIEAMKRTCNEVVLETELTNKAALSLYYNLGFVRPVRLCVCEEAPP